MAHGGEHPAAQPGDAPGRDRDPRHAVPVARPGADCGRALRGGPRAALRAGAKSTLPEHQAQQVAAVSGKRAKRYLQREHLLGLAPPALEHLTELTHRRPRIWIRDVERLHGFLTTSGEDAVRASFVRGLAEQVIGAEYIAHYLARR